MYFCQEAEQTFLACVFFPDITTSQQKGIGDAVASDEANAALILEAVKEQGRPFSFPLGT